MKNKLRNCFSNITFGDISRYRSELMGFAIIEIILLHFFQAYNRYNDNILSVIGTAYIGAVASVGVEFFIIVSGVGLYYSLSSKKPLTTFYKKRFFRVGVPYLIWGTLIWSIWAIYTGGNFFREFFYNLLFGSFVMENELTFWYVPFVILTYLLAPLVYKGVSGKRPFLSVILWVCAALAFTAVVFFVFPDIHKNTRIALHRFPIFFFGMYFGRLSQENRPVTRPMYLLLAFGFVLKLVRVLPVTEKHISFVSIYYVLGFYSLFFLFFAIVFFRVVKGTVVSKGFSAVGRYSFELYITHMGLGKLIPVFNYPNGKIWSFALIILASVVCSLALHFVTNKICGSGKTNSRLPERQ